MAVDGLGCSGVDCSVDHHVRYASNRPSEMALRTACMHVGREGRATWSLTTEAQCCELERIACLMEDEGMHARMYVEGLHASMAHVYHKSGTAKMIDDVHGH